MERTVAVDCAKIKDWHSFHEVFAETFGFPDFYGHNSAAWTDCMTRLDEEFSTIQVARGELVILQLESAEKLKAAAPSVLSDLLEMCAFVNWRRIEVGEPPILLVSGYA